MKMQVRSLALLSGLRIRCCPELWCRSQMWPGSCIAVTVMQASSYGSYLTPTLGTSICHRCRPKKTKTELKKPQNVVIYKNKKKRGKLDGNNFFFFLLSHLWHMKVPGPGGPTGAAAEAYITATATSDPSHICDLHCSLWQCQILNPLIKARYRTCILTETTSGP